MATLITTNEVRVVHLHVFQPQEPGENSSGKYGVQLLIPRDDTDVLEAIAHAVETEGREAFGENFRMNPKIGVFTTRDPIIENKQQDYYEGCMFLNANNRDRPGVFEMVDGHLRELTDPTQFKSGDYARAQIAVSPYGKRQGSAYQGISTYLQMICKTRDGEALESKMSPSQMASQAESAFGGTFAAAEAATTDPWG